MRFIFISEITQCGQDGVRSCLAQAAKGGILDLMAELFHLIEHFHGAVAVGDLGQHFQQTLGADTAGRTLAAGFVTDEFHIEPGNVDHTVVFIQNDHAAGTHHGAGRDQVLIRNGCIQFILCQTAAGRSAGLDSLELLAFGAAAADIVNDLTQSSAHGDLDQTRVVDLAAQREDLGALGLVGTDGGIPFGSLAYDHGNVGNGLYVIDRSRLAPYTGNGRERRLRGRHAAAALDRSDQSCFFTVDKSARAQTDLQVKVKAGIKDVPAQEAQFFRFRDGDPQSGDRDGILGADIDIAVVGTDRVGHDGHAFQDRVRVTFQNGTVHKCARVTFVRVADDILFVTRLVFLKLPFDAGGESRAAASAQTGGLDLINDILGAHGLENFMKRLIAADANVLVDVLGIDLAAVAQGDSLLFLIKTDLFNVIDFGTGILVNVIHLHVTNDIAADDVLIDDPVRVLRFYMGIENTIRKNCDDRSLLAEAKAAGLDDTDLVLQLMLFQELIQALDQFGGFTRGTAGTGAA